MSEFAVCINILTTWRCLVYSWISVWMNSKGGFSQFIMAIITKWREIFERTSRSSILLKSIWICQTNGIPCEKYWSFKSNYRKMVVLSLWQCLTWCWKNIFIIIVYTICILSWREDVKFNSLIHNRFLMLLTTTLHYHTWFYTNAN